MATQERRPTYSKNVGEATARVNPDRVGRRWHPLPVLAVCLLIGGWEITSVAIGVNASTGFKPVPGIEDVAKAFKSFANYWPGGLGVPSTLSGAPPTYPAALLGVLYNTVVSSLRMAAGLAFGLLIGTAAGLLVSWSKLTREAISPLINFARMAPLLAMLPLFAFWFGKSQLGAITFIAFGITVLMFAITVNSLGNVPLYYGQFARMLGAGSIRTYLTVVLPAASPGIRSGVLLSIGFAWSGTLAAEFIGQQYGLGRILKFALYYANSGTIALTGIVVIFIATLLFLAVRKALDWLTRWSE